MCSSVVCVRNVREDVQNPQCLANLHSRSLYRFLWSALWPSAAHSYSTLEPTLYTDPWVILTIYTYTQCHAFNINSQYIWWSLHDIMSHRQMASVLCICLPSWSPSFVVCSICVVVCVCVCQCMVSEASQEGQWKVITHGSLVHNCGLQFCAAIVSVAFGGPTR